MTPQPLTTCRCPRCGYDLSGTVASWTDQCPVEGVCSECGLGFGWRMILNASLRGDPLFFETAMQFLARALIVTQLRSLRPWSFWRWVKMQYPIHFKRLAGCVALWWLLAWLAASVLLGALNFGLYFALEQSNPGQLSPYLAVADVAKLTLWPMSNSFSLTPGFAVFSASGMLWMLLMAASFAILGDTLGRAKVRWAHVVRVGVYQFVAAPIMWTGALLATQLHLWAWFCYDFTTGPVSDLLEDHGEAASNVVTWLTIIGLPVWIVAFWGSACRRYLRIRRPWIVSVVMAFVSGLSAFSVLVWYELLRHH